MKNVASHHHVRLSAMLATLRKFTTQWRHLQRKSVRVMAYLRMSDERTVRARASEFTVTLPSKPKNPALMTGFFFGVYPRSLVI